MQSHDSQQPADAKKTNSQTLNTPPDEKQPGEETPLLQQPGTSRASSSSAPNHNRAEQEQKAPIILQPHYHYYALDVPLANNPSSLFENTRARREATVTGSRRLAHVFSFCGIVSWIYSITQSEKCTSGASFTDCVNDINTNQTSTMILTLLLAIGALLSFGVTIGSEVINDILEKEEKQNRNNGPGIN